MDMDTIRKIREHRTDSVEEDKEIIDRLIDKFKEEDGNHFDTSVLLQIMSENAPEAFDEEHQKEIADFLTEVEKSESRAMICKCMHDIVKEQPDKNLLVPGIKEGLKLRDEMKDKNYKQENLAAYHCINAWEELEQDIPSEALEIISENLNDYSASNESALSSMYSTCIVERQDNKEKAFQELKEILEKTSSNFVVEKTLLEVLRCVEDGPLDKDALERLYEENSSSIEDKSKRKVIEKSL